MNRYGGRRRWMLMTAFVTILLLGGTSALAQTTTTYRDEFASISYGGNDGSSAFSGPWRERGESDGPSRGVLQVVADDRCSGGAGNCLRVGSDGGSIEGIAVDRSADLDGAQAASLNVQWRRRSQGRPDGSVRVRIAPGNGGPWTTLATFPMTGPNGSQTSSFDVTDFATASTTVRFEGVGTAVDAYLLFDDVELSVTRATTTTTSSTTTTTTPGATTTTTPGATTTTTPGATTTTTPGATTTTTPGATTTTTPGTTTTTTPGATTTTTPGTTSGATEPATSLATAPESTTTDGSVDAAQDAASSVESPLASTDDRSSDPGDAGDGAEAALVAPDGGDGQSSTPPIALIASQIVILGGVTAAVTRIGVVPRS